MRLLTPPSLRDSFLGLSLAFYKKDSALRDLVAKAHAGYLANEHGSLLKQSTMEVFKTFCAIALEGQRNLLARDEEGVMGAFYEIIEKCSHDRVLMSFVIPTIDGMLFDNRRNIQILKRILLKENREPNILTRLINLVNAPDYDIIVYEAASRVLAIFLSELDPKLYWIQQENFVNQLLFSGRDKKRRISDHCTMACLASLLRVQTLVKHFLKSNGMEYIATTLKNDSYDVQTVYYAFFACWLLSFESAAIPYFQKAILSVIKLMVQALQSLSREKLIRVGYACFKNLCVNDQCIELMIDAGLIKTTDNILKGVIKDEETLQDIEFVGTTLERNMKILSSFEKYVKEIESGVLEWSPVHSERFWRENVRKFETDEFKYIKKLRDLLQNSDEKVKVKNQAIICYDLGEFCRFHPFGKMTLDNLQVKGSILELINSSEPLVKEHALVAIQKMMLHSWQAANVSAGKE